jgi:DNA-binding beta-propeller fold protein YncE
MYRARYGCSFEGLMRPVQAALFCALLVIAVARAASLPASTFIALVGEPPISMDYLAYDLKGDRLWVPAGNAGKVEVIEARTGSVTVVEGFATAKAKGRDGRERVVGPSAVSIGDGFAYVGNRANAQVCAVDAHSLEKKGCVGLSSPPDGVAWVATTREVWVTTPRDGSITILDAKNGAAPTVTGRIPVAHPEGYAVDADRGLFYTNQEEEDRTLVIDVRRRAVVATWNPGCGPKGPRGLALDGERRQLFVACPTSIKALDAAENGGVLGTLEIGAGADSIDYLQKEHRVYAAAGGAGTLTVAEASEKGILTKIWGAPAAEGGRAVVVDSRGTAYVADSKGGRLIVFK